MTPLVLSDVHLNHCENGDASDVQPVDGADCVLFGGDLTDGVRMKSMRWLADRFAGIPIYAVIGNHDVWRDGKKNGKTYEEFYAMFRELAAKLDITFLERDAAIHPDGTRILGCTLQTDMRHTGGMSRKEAMYYAQTGRMPDSHEYGAPRYRMNDFTATHMISDDGKRRRGTRLTPSRFAAENAKSVSWLEQQLAIPHEDGPTVVLTHMAPTPRSLGGSSFDHMACYAVGGVDGNGLEYMMEGDTAPEVWIHGHIHNSVDYEVGNTRVLSNPRGYPTAYGVENPNWNPRLLIDIEKRLKPTYGMGM